MNRLEIFQQVYGTDYVFTVKELERLRQVTELIVKECVQNLETNKKCDIYTGELTDCGWNDVIQYQIDSLKEHFGVEE